MRSSLLSAALLVSLTALPSLADDTLGIIGADLTLGLSDHPGEGGFVAGTVDVAITGYHGAQVDLQYEERSTGGIGRLGTVLYMTPRTGQKYGLAFMLADRNNMSSTYGQIGAAGMLDLTPAWSVELRAAAGLSADNDLDWITAGTGVHWRPDQRTRVYAQYDLTSFDEETFAARAHEVTFGVKTRIKGSPVSVFAELSRDWLAGANAAPAETTLRAGVSITLGRTGNNQPAFRVPDPMRQLLRRGLY